MNPGRQQTTFDGCSVCVLVGYLKSVLSLGILCIDLFHSWIQFVWLTECCNWLVFNKTHCKFCFCWFCFYCHRRQRFLNSTISDKTEELGLKKCPTVWWSLKSGTSYLVLLTFWLALILLTSHWFFVPTAYVIFLC